MTVADPGLLRARRLLLDHLDMHPGRSVNADLDPAEVGIVGDTAHAVGGDSYHLGADQIRARDGRDRYSVDESPRDKAGLDDNASALDIGWFSVTVRGKTHNLRSFSIWLVAHCKAGDPDTLGIREVIYSPDGIVVRRWDRLGRRTSGDSSHLTHTHLSKFRDADGDPIVRLMRRYLTEIGLLAGPPAPEEDDDMPLSDADVERIAARTASAVHGQKLFRSEDTIGSVLHSLRGAPVLLSAIQRGVTEDHVDEAAIAEAVVAGLNPERLAAAIVHAMPPEQAEQTAALVIQRLGQAIAGLGQQLADTADAGTDGPGF